MKKISQHFNYIKFLIFYFHLMVEFKKIIMLDGNLGTTQKFTFTLYD